MKTLIFAAVSAFTLGFAVAQTTSPDVGTQNSQRYQESVPLQGGGASSKPNQLQSGSENSNPAALQGGGGSAQAGNRQGGNASSNSK